MVYECNGFAGALDPSLGTFFAVRAMKTSTTWKHKILRNLKNTNHKGQILKFTYFDLNTFTEKNLFQRANI